MQIHRKILTLSYKRLQNQCQTMIGDMKSYDIIFPLIHGAYGEDGKLQAFLESHEIAFIGSSSKSCQNIIKILLRNI